MLFLVSISSISSLDAVIYKKQRTKEDLNKESELKHTDNRVIVKVDINYKNKHTFADGTEIYRGRQFNNLNRRETEPVNAIVIDAEHIPKGAEILVHPNALFRDTKINSYREWENNDIEYFSVPTTQCYLWRTNGEEWMPIKGFATALRVFKPYSGGIAGIPPMQIKNILYITSGEFKYLVVHTIKASDYEIIFMGEDGQEKRIIRCRHFENENHDREEIIAVDYGLTEKVKNGELLLGIDKRDAEKL